MRFLRMKANIEIDAGGKTFAAKGARSSEILLSFVDLASVRRAAAETIALDLPIVGLLNNAGIFPLRATKNALGWDNAFATNHIGPFVLTEALISHLPDDANVVFVVLAPHIKYWSTPKRAARVVTKAVLNESGETGIYYDEGGRPMLGSALVRDPKFQDRVVAETRALLSTIPK
jgi:NAD(P)-dependent dehydrogenase (short-subunit alcohol dehydrogenase family)